MPTFNNLIDRTAVEALIREVVAPEIIQGMPKQSMIMSLGRKLSTLPAAVVRMPVLQALPTAYFVNGDTGLKQTTKVEWGNKFLNVEELAVIVPIPEAVLADANYDIWGEVRPLILEALGVAFDAAVIHGTNAPASWPEALVPAAVAAGNTVTLGTGADLYDDVMSEGGLLSKVEEDGFNVTGHLAALSMKSRYRGLRDANGQPIFVQTMQQSTRYELDGQPMVFSENGALDETDVLQISGDFRQLVYALRQDVTFKFLDQAVIQDGAGNIVYNLPQQDMVALRAVMRLAWQVPNPISRVNPSDTTRYPFAALLPAA